MDASVLSVDIGGINHNLISVPFVNRSSINKCPDT